MPKSPNKRANKALQGKIALVAGATRGAGRGIAIALGEAGATVYCTGRSSRKNAKARLAAKPGVSETIEETAELLTAAGGSGIAMRVDHTVPAEVKNLVALIKRRHKHLDILVNDIWGGDALTEFGPEPEPREWDAFAGRVFFAGGGFSAVVSVTRMRRRRSLARSASIGARQGTAPRADAVMAPDPSMPLSVPRSRRRPWSLCPTLPKRAVKALLFSYYGEGDAGVMEVKRRPG